MRLINAISTELWVSHVVIVVYKLNNMNRLENKVIVITGAAMGLGYAAAIEAAKNGALLSLVDYNAESLEKAKAVLLAQYPQAKIITSVADVSDETSVKNM